MDISIFTDFYYDNDDAWNDFMFQNGLSHARYNDALEGLGFTVPTSNLFDMEDSKDGRNDWLMTHYQLHQYLASIIGAIGLADLSDVELNDNNQFDNWLQLHAQAHVVLDEILNVS